MNIKNQKLEVQVIDFLFHNTYSLLSSASIHRRLLAKADTASSFQIVALATFKWRTEGIQSQGMTPKAYHLQQAKL